MQILDAQQLRLLAALPRDQRRSRLLGGALTLIGTAYLMLAIVSFDPRRPASEAEGLDASLTAPILAHYAATEGLLGRMKPATFTEWSLSNWLGAQARTSGALLVLAFRGFLAMVCLLLGLAMLTVTVERARLLRIVHALHPASGGEGAGAEPGEDRPDQPHPSVG